MLVLWSYLDTNWILLYKKCVNVSWLIDKTCSYIVSAGFRAFLGLLSCKTVFLGNFGPKMLVFGSYLDNTWIQLHRKWVKLFRLLNKTQSYIFFAGFRAFLGRLSCKTVFWVFFGHKFPTFFWKNFFFGFFFFLFFFDF